MPDYLLVGLIFFLGVFTQTVSGFGLALVAMPLLVTLLPVQKAVAVTALLAMGSNLTLWLTYRRAWKWEVIGPPLVAGIPAVGLGLYAAGVAPEKCVVGLLGLVVIAFALYGLLRPHLPELHGRGWGYLFGAATGFLAGAYVTAGPPLVVYATCRRWTPEQVRSNFATIFFATGTFTLPGCFFRGDFEPLVWRHALAGAPGMLLGYATGALANRRINADVFRRIVLVLLVVLGLRLIGRGWSLHREVGNPKTAAPARTEPVASTASQP